MKICFLDINPYPYIFGGVKRRIDGLSSELVKNHEIYVISSRAYRKSKLDYPKNIKIINTGLPYVSFGNKKNLKFILSLFYRPFNYFSWILGCIYYLFRIKPDVIDSQDIVVSALPSFGENVITPHGIFGKTIKKLYGKSFLKNFVFLWKFIEKINIKKSKGIICLGKKEKNHYKKYKKTFIVANGIDSEKFKPGKIDKKLISYVGRLSKEKNVEEIIKAMQVLPDFNLIVVGDGPEKEKLEKTAGNNVKFLGFQKNPEKYLKKSNIFIMASEFETLPFSLLEAMSCGNIVLTTKVGEIPNLVEAGINGFFLKKGKAKEISEKVIEINKLKNKELEKIRKNAIETARKHNWKNKAKKLEKVYKKILLDN